MPAAVLLCLRTSVVRTTLPCRGVGEDRAKILTTKGYKGVLGTFSFTPNGDGLSEVSVVQIEKGKPKLLKVVNVEPK